MLLSSRLERNPQLITCSAVKQDSYIFEVVLSPDTREICFSRPKGHLWSI